MGGGVLHCSSRPQWKLLSTVEHRVITPLRKRPGPIRQRGDHANKCVRVVENFENKGGSRQGAVQLDLILIFHFYHDTNVHLGRIEFTVWLEL